MANVLPRSKQLAVIGALVEGTSVRATERQTEVHRDTIIRLMVRVGCGCALLLDEKMVNLTGSRYELDEVWGFIGKKQRHVRSKDDPARVGDIWTFTAIDANSKLVPVFRVGKRDQQTTEMFILDLASRLHHRVQITTDGFGPYAATIPAAFNGEVDYAQSIKQYEAEPAGFGRYSPPKVIATTKIPICGFPEEDLVSTSYAERQNLTMRTNIRRLTRLTNAFSKKLENHYAATALYFGYYNFVRRHMTLRWTPAMEAGIETTMWELGDLLDAALDRMEAYDRTAGAER
jgi:IS1 family transposase